MEIEDIASDLAIKALEERLMRDFNLSMEQTVMAHDCAPWVLSQIWGAEMGDHKDYIVIGIPLKASDPVAEGLPDHVVLCENTPDEVRVPLRYLTIPAI